MEDPEKLAKIRADLVKELFPIAITVGFVERVSQMDWLLSGSAPSLSYRESANLLRLLIATVLAILAWDWYHRDIKISPISSVWRYLLDVLIVLGYLLFMLTQEHHRAWMATLISIFVLWIVLDIVSVISDPKSYEIKGAEFPITGLRSGYCGAFLGKGIRIPAINLTWFVYFSALAALSWSSSDGDLVTPLFVGLGLSLVWCDSNYRYVTRASHSAGFGSPGRGALVICLLLLYWAAVSYALP
jgi:hypothetical protein